MYNIHLTLLAQPYIPWSPVLGLVKVLLCCCFRPCSQGLCWCRFRPCSLGLWWCCWWSSSCAGGSYGTGSACWLVGCCLTSLWGINKEVIKFCETNARTDWANHFIWFSMTSLQLMELRVRPQMDQRSVRRNVLFNLRGDLMTTTHWTLTPGQLSKDGSGHQLKSLSLILQIYCNLLVNDCWQ